jgi:hypothetical protein
MTLIGYVTEIDVYAKEDVFYEFYSELLGLFS